MVCNISRLFQNLTLKASCQTSAPKFHTSSVLHPYNTYWNAHLRGGPPNRGPRGYKNPIHPFPMMRGVVVKLVIKKPFKPNSGNRRCALVRLRNGKEIVCWIPGEGHNLQEHSQVKVRYAIKQDLVGVRLMCVRGQLDLAPVVKKVRTAAAPVVAPKKS